MTEKLIIHHLDYFLFTFTSLLVTFQSVTVVTSARETSDIVKAKLRASIGAILTFVDILKTFSTFRKMKISLAIRQIELTKPNQRSCVTLALTDIVIIYFYILFSWQTNSEKKPTSRKKEK